MTDVLRILLPLMVWLAAFGGVYGLHGLLCGHAIEGVVLGSIALSRAVMAGAYALAIVALATVLLILDARRFASGSPFVRFVSRATGWTALVAVVWTLAPVLGTTSCF
jgi:hypothetical protein